MNGKPFPSAAKNNRWLFVTLFLFLAITVGFLSCKKELLNKAPIAIAGADVSITLPTDNRLLDGSASSDPDGTINEWKWTKVSGPASFAFDNAASSITVVKNLVAGTYQFELMVTDNGGLSAKDTVVVIVNNVPVAGQPPVADAGQDQTITLPTNSIVLNGSGSTDPNNNISAYLWSKIAGPSSVAIINPISFQTPVNNLVQGVYQFELKVTDAGGLFDLDTIQVTVNPDLSLAIEWQKVLGGSRVDLAQSIHPTPDGGFIIAGNTNSENGDIIGYHPGPYGCYITCFNQTICGYYPDGLVVKLSSTGAIQWQRAVGGSAADNLLSIISTADGGYIASGLTYSNDGDVSGFHGGNEADAWVVKLSSSGDVQWQKALGGSTGCDFANYILSTSDGGYIFAGHTDSKDGDVTSIARKKDVWIVKLSSSGALQWQKTIGGAEDDYAFSLQSTPDGGYITTGYTYSNNGDVSGNHGDADAWVVKLSSSGAIQWQKALGGTSEETARSIQPTSDGGYIVAASTKSNNGDVSGNQGGTDAWIIKLSSNGDIQWQKALGGGSEDVGRSVQATTDGGYIITGSTKSNNGDVRGNHGGQDVWVVKLSSSGAVQWQKAMGGTADDFSNSIQSTADGSFVVAGQTFSNNGDVNGYRGDADAWIIKLKP